MPVGLGYAPTTEDPFYNWQDFQRDPNQDWTQTPAIGGPSGYLERNPDAAYTRWMSRIGMGLGNTSPFAEYVQNYVRNQANTGYKAALAEDPTLKYQNYLTQLGSISDLYNRFRGLTARQRGVYPMGPTRTIADI